MNDSLIAFEPLETPPLATPPLATPGILVAESPQVGPAVPVAAPLAPPIAPKPKPIIIPERVEDGWKTPSLHLKRATAGFYLTLFPTPSTPAVRSQVIHLTTREIEGLMRLADGDQGLLWRRLSEIPLARPMPSRALEDELRTLLRTFGSELRARRGNS